MKENNILISDPQIESEGAVIENESCAFSMPSAMVRRTIGKTTYVANLHFKDQGQTFAQKLKRVLKAEIGQPIS